MPIVIGCMKWRDLLKHPPLKTMDSLRFDKRIIRERIEKGIDEYKENRDVKNYAKGVIGIRIINGQYSNNPKFVRVYVGSYGDKKLFSSKSDGKELDYGAIQEAAIEEGRSYAAANESYRQKEAIKESNRSDAEALSEIAPFSVYASDKPGEFNLYFGTYRSFTKAQVEKIIEALA